MNETNRDFLSLNTNGMRENLKYKLIHQDYYEIR